MTGGGAGVCETARKRSESARSRRPSRPRRPTRRAASSCRNLEPERALPLVDELLGEDGDVGRAGGSCDAVDGGTNLSLLQDVLGASAAILAVLSPGQRGECAEGERADLALTHLEERAGRLDLGLEADEDVDAGLRVRRRRASQLGAPGSARAASPSRPDAGRPRPCPPLRWTQVSTQQTPEPVGLSAWDLEKEERGMLVGAGGGEGRTRGAHLDVAQLVGRHEPVLEASHSLGRHHLRQSSVVEAERVGGRKERDDRARRPPPRKFRRSGRSRTHVRRRQRGSARADSPGFAERSVPVRRDRGRTENEGERAGEERAQRRREGYCTFCDFERFVLVAPPCDSSPPPSLDPSLALPRYSLRAPRGSGG